MISPQQISAVSSKLSEKITDLLDYFGIEYSVHNDMYAFPCPVHGGDNASACSIFTDGRPNWSCWTHSCQDEYKKTLFGFVRGVLSFRAGRTVTMYETADFCRDFLDYNLEDLPEIEENLTVKKQIKMLETFEKKPIRAATKIDRELIIKSLDIPSKYYLKREFSSEILTKFNVGDCFKHGKLMNARAVVPVFDEDDNYVGCTGRSVYENNPNKWINSPGFTKGQFLYGLNYAKESIIETGIVIIVEGQGDVWRAHEAGFTNVVGIMGASLSDEQLILLECSGCLNVAILTDMDDAGDIAAEKIIEKSGRRFNCKRFTIPAHDIGDMNIKELKPFLENVCQGF